MATPVGIAADLVAQAEHDPEAFAILITTNETLPRWSPEVKRQAAGNAIAEEALAAQGSSLLRRPWPTPRPSPIASPRCTSSVDAGADSAG